MISTETRLQVYQKANGRCEYCLVLEKDGFLPHQIDHILPKQHSGSDDIENLALSCVICNRNKGPNMATLDPKTGKLTCFFNPRTQRWNDHFSISDGLISGLTPEGRATVVIFRFNQ
jgi:hypothetical protein